MISSNRPAGASTSSTPGQSEVHTNARVCSFIQRGDGLLVPPSMHVITVAKPPGWHTDRL